MLCNSFLGECVQNFETIKACSFACDVADGIVATITLHTYTVIFVCVRLHFGAETRCVGFLPSSLIPPYRPVCKPPCLHRGCPPLGCNSLSLTHCSTVNHAYCTVHLIYGDSQRKRMRYPNLDFSCVYIFYLYLFQSKIQFRIFVVYILLFLFILPITQK